MRAISLKCPNCSANLQSSETAQVLSCTYCGTQSRIQHRTRVFERKIELPPIQAGQHQMPIAAQGHRMSWMIAVFSIVPLFIVAGVGFTVMKSEKMAGSSITRYEASGSPLLSDINGDGHVDIVGRTSVYDTNGRYLRYYLTAYNGLSGAKLWTSTSIGTSDFVV